MQNSHTSLNISATSFRKDEYVYKTKFTYMIGSTLNMVTKNVEIYDLKSYTHDLINILFKEVK